MGSKVFHYMKGLNHAYTQSCAELAEIAMADGPSFMVGKTGEDMPWRDRAHEYLATEKKVLSGLTHQTCVYARYFNRDHLVLDNKSPLLDRNDRIIGLIGSTMETGSSQSAFRSHPALMKDGSLFISIGSEKIHLTKRETVVLKWILRGKMTSEIGLLENRSTRTIEGHIANIKRKLQAQTKGDIIYIAHQLGLLHLTFESG